MEALGIALGIALGLLSGLVPGFHLATLLVFGLGFGLHEVLGNTVMAIAIACGAGVTMYVRHLSHTYHPTAQSQLHLADPAVRMAYGGRGKAALAILSDATRRATFVVLPVTVVFALLGPFGLLPNRVPAIVAIAVIVGWAYLTAVRSGQAAMAGIGLGVTGLYGYAVMHNPVLRGSEHTLAPLLAGMFAIPSAVLVLWESAQAKPVKFPAQVPVGTITISPIIGWVGPILGALTGFLAGIGSGSLVSALQDIPEGDEEYVHLQGSAEAANDIMAIGLAVSIGLGRSGEAATLNTILPKPTLALSLMVVLALALGLWVGSILVNKFASTYVKTVTKIPAVYFATFVLFTALASSFLAAQWLGVMMALIGLPIALFLRAIGLPAQASLACLALPVLAYYLGLVGPLNAILF